VGRGGIRHRRRAGVGRLVGHARQPVDVGTVHGLLLKQQAHQSVELLAVGPQQVDRPLLCLPEQPRHLVVDRCLGSLRVRPAGHARAARAEEDRPALGVANGAELR